MPHSRSIGGKPLNPMRVLTTAGRSPTVPGAYTGRERRLRINVQGGAVMETTRGNARRAAQYVLAAAVSDVAYRLFMREPLRRALGIDAKHA